jgi:hypothetical protein
MTDAQFTVDDFERLSGLVLDAWGSAVDRDWSVPAGTLEWSCFFTADHTVDCVFSYAFFLASRRLGTIPPFGELHALPGAAPLDLIDGLRASCAMLSAVIRAAEPGTRAVLWGLPCFEPGSPADFAARGGHELILHAPTYAPAWAFPSTRRAISAWDCAPQRAGGRSGPRSCPPATRGRTSSSDPGDPGCPDRGLTIGKGWKKRGGRR